MALKTDRILVLDLELTCGPEFKLDDREIIEIGLAVVDMKKRTIERNEGFFVKPDKTEVSEYCTHLTGITTQILKTQGHPLKEVLNTIKKTYSLSSSIWGAWGSDRDVIVRECRDKEIEYPFNEDYFNFAYLLYSSMREEYPLIIHLNSYPYAFFLRLTYCTWHYVFFNTSPTT